MISATSYLMSQAKGYFGSLPPTFRTRLETATPKITTLLRGMLCSGAKFIASDNTGTKSGPPPIPAALATAEATPTSENPR
jgi:hypothetical protein